MIDIAFCMPIDPRGKGRPRSTAVAGMVRTYTDKKTRLFEAQVSALSSPYRPPAVIDVPVEVTIRAFFKRPQALCRVSKRTGKLLGGHSEEPIWMHTRPDVDNVAKAVLDGMQAWWLDDSLVVSLVATKQYVAIGDAPCICVRVRGLTTMFAG